MSSLAPLLGALGRHHGSVGARQIRTPVVGGGFCNHMSTYGGAGGSSSNPPPPRQPTRRPMWMRSRMLLRSAPPNRAQQQEWSADKFDLRRNAVTVFPGDYHDRQDLFEEAEKEWSDPNADAQAAEDKRDLDRSQQVQKIMREKEARKAARRVERMERLKATQRHEPKIHPVTGQTYSRGGRKCATARVYLEPGMGEITVNQQDFGEYFIRESLRDHILEPLLVTETLGKFDVTAFVRGGGLSGQAGAIRWGVTKCLNHYNSAQYRPALKFKGLLTRDARIVEPKKTGLVKARKAPQWVRR